MNHADFWVTPKARWISYELIPFFADLTVALAHQVLYRHLQLLCQVHERPHLPRTVLTNGHAYGGL
jgi:hypothetical protein